MKSIRVFAAVAVVSLAALVGSSSAHAYGLTGVGGSGGFVDPEGRGTTGSVGVHAEMEQEGSRIHLVPGLMYWRSDETKDINPNMDVIYHVRRDNKVGPYVGAGLGMHVKNGPLQSDGDTDLGVNVMGGVRIPMNAARIFVEGRHTMSDDNQSAILAGATFKLGSQ